MGKSNLVRFDWAAKRLLRNKSNFVVLEGFLSVLLEDEIHIERILESEGNQQKFDDKFNRVDMLAENSKGELVIIEVQNNRELDYFHRMLYGTSKAITEYINQGDPYAKVKKVLFILIWGREMITCITGTRSSGEFIQKMYCDYPFNNKNSLFVMMPGSYSRSITCYVWTSLIS